MSRLRRVAPCDVNGAAAPPGALVIGLGLLFKIVPQIPERIAPAARAMRHAKNIGTICVTGRMQLRREIPSSFNFY